MKKYLYKLMAPGHKVVGKDEEGKDIVWDVVFYSDMKKVYAQNEESALSEMRSKLKRKWVGFRTFGTE